MTGVRESLVVAKKMCGLPPMCGWYMKAQAATRRRVPNRCHLHSSSTNAATKRGVAQL